jgi:hypothetical protein
MAAAARSLCDEEPAAALRSAPQPRKGDPHRHYRHVGRFPQSVMVSREKQRPPMPRSWMCRRPRRSTVQWLRRNVGPPGQMQTRSASSGNECRRAKLDNYRMLTPQGKRPPGRTLGGCLPAAASAPAT